MDNERFESEVAARMTKVIMEVFGSVNAASKASGIPYASLDRKLKTPGLFTVAELRRLAHASDRPVKSFIPHDGGKTYRAPSSPSSRRSA